MSQSFPFHHQDSDVYCGPACLMMLLEKEQASLNGLLQADLMSDVVTGHGQLEAVSPADWASAPRALTYAINQRLSQLTASGLSYEVFPPHPPGGAAVSPPWSAYATLIRERLRDADAPVFVLTNGGEHWVLVFETRRTGFKVRWPESLRQPEGAGLAHDASMPGSNPCEACRVRRRSRSVVFTEAGLREVFSPVAGRTDHYQGQRLMLIPTRAATVPPGAGTPAPVPPPGPPAPGPDDGMAARAMQRRARPHTEDKAAIKRMVRDTVESEMVLFADLFEEHGEKLSTAVVGEPVPVEFRREPVPGQPRYAYWLAPIFTCAATPEGADSAQRALEPEPDAEPYFVARVSADGERLLQLESIRGIQPDQETWIYKVLNEDALEQRILQGLQESEQYVPRSWQSTGRLVWEYSRQSLSPMEPLHEIRRGSEIAYVDLYGRIHRELTLPRRREKTSGSDDQKRKA